MREQDSYCNMTQEEVDSFSRQFVTRNVLFPNLLDAMFGEPPSLKTKCLVSKRGPLAGVSAVTCCMLDGSLMHRVKCRVYDRRPSVCRRVIQPGDKHCREIRKLFQDFIKKEVGVDTR